MIAHARFGFLLIFIAMCATAGSAQAMMAGRVDGRTVYYSAEQNYEVDESLVYLGGYRSEITGGNVNDSTKRYGVPVQNEVFGVVDPASGRVVELFLAQWELWPVGLKEQGPLKLDELL